MKAITKKTGARVESAKIYSPSLADYKPTIVRVEPNWDGPNHHFWDENRKYSKDEKDFVQWTPALANKFHQIPLSSLLFTYEQAERELQFTINELRKVLS